ncbi:MAG: hypothetical protein MK135_07200, partial [Polyangiaceae bacterium]|nr:hypothetical protein [Polyangiaceae bacterium]
AVARWGRVTMISPRAPRRGFPWQDTLAHEITHLLLARGSADRAPLWLQEGIAKREETRWRAPRFLDKTPPAQEVAFNAWRDGKSVGITQLGASIAMLPSAEAASIAYAEVTSFMEFWIQENGGSQALGLLLRELAVTKDDDAAIRSVSGYGIEEWELIWRTSLNEKYEQMDEQLSLEEEAVENAGPREVRRYRRLGELLTLFAQVKEARELVAPELDRAPHVAGLRFIAARAALLAEADDAQDLLGDELGLSRAEPAWLALKARPEFRQTSDDKYQKMEEQAVGIDPYLPVVACDGQIDPRLFPRPPETVGSVGHSLSQEFLDALSPLCRAALERPLREAF